MWEYFHSKLMAMKEVLSVLTTKETKLWEDMQNFFKGIMEQARNDPQIKEKIGRAHV